MGKKSVWLTDKIRMSGRSASCILVGFKSEYMYFQLVAQKSHKEGTSAYIWSRGDSPVSMPK